MKRQPPTLATVLLQRFVNPDGAILGDLVEQFQSGRSRAWYWRQITGVIASSVVRDVRAHPILTIRGIAVAWLFGWAIVRRLYYALRFDEVLFASGFRWFYVNGYGLPHGLQGAIVVSCFGWLLGAVCGWIVARLHRPFGIPILIANLVFVYLWTAVSFVPNPYLTPLGVLNLLMYPILTLSGGVFERMREPVISHG